MPTGKKVDRNSDLLSNLGGQATIFLIQDLQTRVGMFKNMGGNIPGGNLLGGSFPDTEFLNSQIYIEL